MFPFAMADDWCGEFERRKRATLAELADRNRR
jgi:hypothetical protein